jgi:type I restriction enzyme S subunit
MKLPSEWEMKTLGELGTCHIGLTYKPDNVVPEGGALVLRSSNIQQSRLVFDDNVFVNMDVPSKLKVCYGDILICVRNGSRSLIGKSAVIEREHAIENLTFGAFMSVYRTDHHDYVRHLFHSDMYYRQIRNNLGATINQITNKNLNNFTFPFPKSSAERNKISEVLSTIDKKIDLIDQKIAETEKLKTGLMQKLFSEGVGVQDENGNWQPHTDYETVEGSKIPKGWLKTTLSQVIKVKSGDSLSKKNMKEGCIPVFGGNGISGYHSKANFNSPQLVIGRVGEYCGAVHITPEKSWITDNALLITETLINVSFEFLYYLLVSVDLNKYASRNAQPLVSGRTLNLVTVKVPQEAEQYEIVNILSTVDRKLILLNRQIEETRRLKKGLMQKLLTGELRVPVEETEAA